MLIQCGWKIQDLSWLAIMTFGDKLMVYYMVNHIQGKYLFPKFLNLSNKIIYLVGICHTFALDFWPWDQPKGQLSYWRSGINLILKIMILTNWLFKKLFMQLLSMVVFCQFDIFPVGTYSSKKCLKMLENMFAWYITIFLLESIRRYIVSSISIFGILVRVKVSKSLNHDSCKYELILLFLDGTCIFKNLQNSSFYAKEDLSKGLHKSWKIEVLLAKNLIGTLNHKMIATQTNYFKKDLKKYFIDSTSHWRNWTSMNSKEATFLSWSIPLETIF